MFQNVSGLGRVENHHSKERLQDGLEMDISITDTSRFAKFFHKDQIDDDQIPTVEAIEAINERTTDKRGQIMVPTPTERDYYDPMNEELVKSVLKSMDVAEAGAKTGVKLVKRRGGDNPKEIDVNISKVSPELECCLNPVSEIGYHVSWDPIYSHCPFFLLAYNQNNQGNHHNR